MACEKRVMPGGAVAIVCGRGRRAPACQSCGKPSVVLCDYPVTTHKSGTCDRPCCRAHAVRVGEDRDYCTVHHSHAVKMGEIAG